MERFGSLTLNGITDANLVTILQIKEKYEGELEFSPNGMQPVFEPAPGQYPQPGRPLEPKQVGYDNAVLSWKHGKGLNAVLEILQAVLVTT
jgi:hypothetical protein